MKLLVVISALVGISMAQRPTYAGSSPIGVPKLASRFQNTSGDISTTQSNLVNRFGVDADAPTPRIPTDARGDVALVDRLNSWPRENRPFWLINADHIERHRHPNGGGPNDSISSAQNVPIDNQAFVGNNGNRIPVNNRSSQNGEGQAQFTQNRGSFGQEQPTAQNSFTVLSNNQMKTYVYDPVSDSWVAMQS